MIWTFGHVIDSAGVNAGVGRSPILPCVVWNVNSTQYGDFWVYGSLASASYLTGVFLVESFQWRWRQAMRQLSKTVEHWKSLSATVHVRCLRMFKELNDIRDTTLQYRLSRSSHHQAANSTCPPPNCIDAGSDCFTCHI